MVDFGASDAGELSNLVHWSLERRREAVSGVFFSE